VSHADAVDAERQRATERALVVAARDGAARLHVSALAGEVLSLGAFHREPRGSSPPARWRRWTGGRAVAAGDGVRLITLALPHRSALAAAAAEELRPEQALNRAVRGVLAALARFGVEATYPGLDAVTAGGRAIAQLGLAEHPDGGALFQAVLAWDGSLARTAALLDRADPDGVVPMALEAASAFTSVRERAPAASAADVAALAAAVGEGYRETFRTDVLPGSPPAAGARAVGPADAPTAGVEPRPGARTAMRTGRIGPVTAWLFRDGDRVVDAGLSGDFIAPLTLPAELGRRVAGVGASRTALAEALTGWLDGRSRYLLGIRESELIDLLATAAERTAPDSDHDVG
jgi:hypothetical protein